MTANLFIVSYEVGLDGYHSYLVYDENTDNDNDFSTNASEVRILRGGPGSNYGELTEPSVLVEVYDDVTDSEDWDELQSATNLTPISASWSAM